MSTAQEIQIDHFALYSRLLDTEFSDDYWSDMAMDEAINYLNNFDPEDWRKLSKNLPDKPLVWQARCAATMSETSAEKGIPILLQLMNSDDEDIVEASVDSLNSFKQSGATFVLSTQQKQTLENLAKKSGIVSLVASKLVT